MLARAPAKLILSGEHAVVYGQPALALAIDKYVFTSIKPFKENLFQFKFVNLNLVVGLTSQQLRELKQTVAANKRIAHPVELLQYAFIYFMEALDFDCVHGLEITIESSIPIGCGLGSSAASIISLLHGLCCYFAKPLSLDEYVVLGRQVENLQHGVSSGLDLFISAHGGYYYFDHGKFTKKELPQLPMILVNSGKPESTTGECVAHAAKFLSAQVVLDDFATVTTAMALAIENHNIFALQDCIRENHRLLQHIGIVPTKVGQFIAAVEALDAAAKISGAGAVKGANGGIIIVIGDIGITQLAHQFGFEVLPVSGEANGVRLV